MGVTGGPNIVEDGLIFATDAGNKSCYISGSTTCKNLLSYGTGSLQGASGTQTSPIYDPDGNGCWLMDGTDDCVNFGTTSPVASLAGTANITLDVWVRKVSSDDIATTGAWTSSGGYKGFFLQWYVNDYVYMAVADTGHSYVYYNSITYTDAWYNMVGVYDGSLSASDRVTFYVNGINYAQNGTGGTIPTSMNATPVNMKIGAQDTGQYGDNRWGPVKIYNRSLTASEIKQNYNQLKGRFQ